MNRVQVFIDYPREDERVSSNVYTFRVGTVPQAAKVEVSVDGEPWTACRQASGYWWHDWVGFEPMRHQLRARAFGHDGTITESRVRKFQRL